jgi:hypothetical protein
MALAMAAPGRVEDGHLGPAMQELALARSEESQNPVHKPKLP